MLYVNEETWNYTATDSRNVIELVKCSLFKKAVGLSLCSVNKDSQNNWM